MRSKAANDKNYKIQADLINRLTKGSPERETRIDFIIGMDKKIGRIKKMSISSFQGAKQAYIRPRDNNRSVVPQMRANSRIEHEKPKRLEELMSQRKAFQSVTLSKQVQKPKPSE